MESFFYVVVRADTEVYIIDLIAQRYGWTIEEIYDLDVVILRDICKIIKKKNEEERVFQQWLALLPAMAAKLIKFIDYKDFKAQMTGQELDLRPKEEIIAEAHEIRKEISGK